MLRHPIMMLYTELKWHPHKTWYYTNFFIFIAFLISFTTHAAYAVDFYQCDCFQTFNKSECLGHENQTECQMNLVKKCTDIIGWNYENQTQCENDYDQVYTITRYITWIFWFF